MSNFLSFFRKEFRPKVAVIKDDIIARRNKDFFAPFGTQIYCGRQGSGKTISAVKHVINMKFRYPKSILVSNLRINRLHPLSIKPKYNGTIKTDFDLQETIENMNKLTQYFYFQTPEELEMVLVGVNNGTYGVIYLIDEIHTYFNSLESKNIPMYVFTEISQQRKQRKLIIGTSQLFLRTAKPLREQCDNVIICSTKLGFLTVQQVYDGMTLDQDFNGKLTGTKKKTSWFFQTRRLRDSFDTFQKVVSGVDQYEQQNNITLQVNSKGKKLQIKSG